MPAAAPWGWRPPAGKRETGSLSSVSFNLSGRISFFFFLSSVQCAPNVELGVGCVTELTTWQANERLAPHRRFARQTTGTSTVGHQKHNLLRCPGSPRSNGHISSSSPSPDRPTNRPEVSCVAPEKRTCATLACSQSFACRTSSSVFTLATCSTPERRNGDADEATRGRNTNASSPVKIKMRPAPWEQVPPPSAPLLATRHTPANDEQSTITSLMQTFILLPPDRRLACRPLFCPIFPLLHLHPALRFPASFIFSDRNRPLGLLLGFTRA